MHKAIKNSYQATQNLNGQRPTGNGQQGSRNASFGFSGTANLSSAEDKAKTLARIRIGPDDV